MVVLQHHENLTRYIYSCSNYCARTHMACIRGAFSGALARSACRFRETSPEPGDGLQISISCLLLAKRTLEEARVVWPLLGKKPNALQHSGSSSLEKKSPAFATQPLQFSKAPLEVFAATLLQAVGTIHLCFILHMLHTLARHGGKKEDASSCLHANLAAACVMLMQHPELQCPGTEPPRPFRKAAGVLQSAKHFVQRHL